MNFDFKDFLSCDKKKLYNHYSFFTPFIEGMTNFEKDIIMREIINNVSTGSPGNYVSLDQAVNYAIRRNRDPINEIFVVNQAFIEASISLMHENFIKGQEMSSYIDRIIHDMIFILVVPKQFYSR